MVERTEERPGPFRLLFLGSVGGGEEVEVEEVEEVVEYDTLSFFGRGGSAATSRGDDDAGLSAISFARTFLTMSSPNGWNRDGSSSVTASGVTLFKYPSDLIDLLS